MKLLATLLVFAALNLLARAESPAAAKPPSPCAPLEFLVGGVWVASVSEPGQPSTTIELRVERNENQQGLRFRSEFVRGAKHDPYTNGLYAWNGAKKKLVIVYTDMTGSLTEGDLTQEGETLVHTLTATGPTGKIEPVQVRMTPIGSDVFTNEIYLSKNGAWEKFIAVRYERKT